MLALAFLSARVYLRIRGLLSGRLGPDNEKEHKQRPIGAICAHYCIVVFCRKNNASMQKVWNPIAFLGGTVMEDGGKTKKIVANSLAGVQVAFRCIQYLILKDFYKVTAKNVVKKRTI